jgi:Cys-rich four helix bundle protein (predicted Tat secretion target)
MDRRQFVKAGSSMMLASVAATALAADDMSGHEHHQQGAKGAYGGEGGAKKYSTLVEATAACVKAGEVCLEHCLSLLRTGDTSMARCSTTVSAMLPLCRAGLALAIQDSPRLKELAAVCAKTCRDCEAACKEHATHHEACRWCMESCQKCAAECEKVAA